MLSEERDRLRDTNSFTILEYIKTSIEILMNMKMEEHHDQNQKNKKNKKNKVRKSNAGDDQHSETESNTSADDPPSDYE